MAVKGSLGSSNKKKKKKHFREHQEGKVQGEREEEEHETR